jgi:hypothetical protein
MIVSRRHPPISFALFANRQGLTRPTILLFMDVVFCGQKSVESSGLKDVLRLFRFISLLFIGFLSDICIAIASMLEIAETLSIILRLRPALLCCWRDFFPHHRQETHENSKHLTGMWTCVDTLLFHSLLYTQLTFFAINPKTDHQNNSSKVP